MRHTTSLLTSLVTLALLAGAAVAEQDQPTPADPPPAAAPVAVKAEPVPPPPGDALNTKCLSEIRADPQWKEQLRNELRQIVGVPEIDPPVGGHQSVMRSACNSLMRTNLAFRNQVREQILLPDVRAQLADVIRIDVHKADANRMLRNKRHVIYTYSFLWVCMAGFVVFMWRRQRSLGEEIERLRKDLERATKE